MSIRSIFSLWKTKCCFLIGGKCLRKNFFGLWLWSTTKYVQVGPSQHRRKKGSSMVGTGHLKRKLQLLRFRIVSCQAGFETNHFAAGECRLHILRYHSFDSFCTLLTKNSPLGCVLRSFLKQCAPHSSKGIMNDMTFGTFLIRGRYGSHPESRWNADEITWMT